MPEPVPHRIHLLIRRIKRLRELREKADPASGIGLWVCRGPLERSQDNIDPGDIDDGVQGDPNRRNDDFIGAEMDDEASMHQVLDLLIEAAHKSLAFNIRFAQDLRKQVVDEYDKALETAGAFADNPATRMKR